MGNKHGKSKSEKKEEGHPKPVWEKIGQGSYGTVWLNRAKGTVLKKEYFPRWAGIKQSVIKELSVYNQFQFEEESRCLPRLIDFSLSTKKTYLDIESEMEIEAGLYNLRNRSLNPELFAELFYKTAKCIGFLNIQGILHSDIKPDNIIVDKDNSVRIIDFGIAQIDRSAKQVYPKQYPTYSLWYRPPEVLLGLQYGFEADIFAIALTFLELHMGEVYLEGANPEDQLIHQYHYLAVKTGQGYKSGQPVNIEKVMKRACLDRKTPYNLYMQEEWKNKQNRPKIKDPLLLDLLTGMLNPSISQRYRYEKILDHPYFKQFNLEPPKLIDRYYNFVPLKYKCDRYPAFKKLFLWLAKRALKSKYRLSTVLLSFHLLASQRHYEVWGKLYACICLRLACNLYEVDPPVPDDFKPYLKPREMDEFIDLELVIYERLNYNIFITTPLDYYQLSHPVWKVDEIADIIGLYFSKEQTVFTMNPRNSVKLKPDIDEDYREIVPSMAEKFVRRFNRLP